MKRFIILFLLITTTCFAFDAWDESGEAGRLESNLAKFVVQQENILYWEGHEFESLYAFDMGRIYENSMATYQVDMKVGTRYVFYTLTTGELVYVCVRKDSDKHYYDGKISNKVVYNFIPTESGSYHYVVKSMAGDKRGLHYSCVDYITK